MSETLTDLAQTWLASLDCIVLALIVGALVWDRRRLIQTLNRHVEARLTEQDQMAARMVETATTLQKLTIVVESLRKP